MTAAPLWDGTVFFFLSPGPAAITFPARQRPRLGRGLVLCGLFALCPSAHAAGGCRAFSFI